jgi:hypothetical protein
MAKEVQEIASRGREEHRLEDIGLTLAESKTLLTAAQKILVKQQLAEYPQGQRSCPDCGTLLHGATVQPTCS